jgi:hypothetical protein
MSNALTPQNLTANAVFDIDLDQIQGDVLIGLQKLAEQFLFFPIKDVAGFKSLLRKKIAPRITMDEPVANYPAGKVRSTLQEPTDFIVPTAAGYFFVPSIEALTNELCG